jgi:glyoxylase-like metal-dependent hydrolase (beta-lactamase superfamily II)
LPPIVETLGNGFDKNLCYVFGCPKTGEGALIDAGIRADRVLAAFAELGLRPVALLVTHAHGDHLSEAPEFLRRTAARVHAFDPGVRGRLAGADVRLLADGDEIAIGEERVVTLHTPGHSPDSVCFHAGGILFTGDTLFVGRTGRTLGPGASTRELYRSVRRLKQLPPGTVLHPGHDYGSSPTSTLARELAENPFLQAETEDDFVAVMERYERNRRRA